MIFSLFFPKYFRPCQSLSEDIFLPYGKHFSKEYNVNLFTKRADRTHQHFKEQDNLNTTQRWVIFPILRKRRCQLVSLVPNWRFPAAERRNKTEAILFVSIVLKRLSKILYATSALCLLQTISLFSRETIDSPPERFQRKIKSSHRLAKFAQTVQH